MDDAIDMPASSALVSHGTQYPVVSVGDGEPILFVHGAWADHRIWHATWRRVADRHTFLAVSQRHFGPWTWPSRVPYSRDVHAEDLAGIVSTLGSPVHLVGWSYAGASLLGAAEALPHLVRGLVLYEPSLPELIGDTDEGRRAIEEFGEGLAAAYRFARQGDLDRAIREGLEFVFGLRGGGFAELDAATRGVFLANTHTVVPDLEAPVPTPWTRAALAEISQPALVVVGARTHDQYRLEAEMLVDTMPNATLATVDGVGHGGPVQDPTTYTDLAFDFLGHHTA